MSKHFFDYDDGDFAYAVSDNMAIDSDGNMMMRMGVAAAFIYAFFQKGIKFIAQTPCYVTSLKNKFWPSAYVGGEVTPEYLGVGYIIGPRLAGVMVAGGVLS